MVRRYPGGGGVEKRFSPSHLSALRTFNSKYTCKCSKSIISPEMCYSHTFTCSYFLCLLDWCVSTTLDYNQQHRSHPSNVIYVTLLANWVALWRRVLSHSGNCSSVWNPPISSIINRTTSVTFILITSSHLLLALLNVHLSLVWPNVYLPISAFSILSF